MKSFIQKISILLVTLVSSSLIFAQDKSDKLIADCAAAKEAFIKADSLMSHMFNTAPGYVIFPNIGKGAIGVGGAAGNGILYEHSKPVGKADMTQVTVGFQFGGKAYREVIFFEDQAALENFKAGKLKFSAQASAVAVKT